MIPASDMAPFAALPPQQQYRIKQWLAIIAAIEASDRSVISTARRHSAQLKDQRGFSVFNILRNYHRYKEHGWRVLVDERGKLQK